MKNILKYLPLVAMLFTACDPDGITEVPAQYQRPRVSDYTPKVNDSAPANPGAEVTLTGVNLENTAAVVIDGIEAQITSKSFKTLKFKVPMSPNYVQAQTYKTTLELLSTQEKPGEYSWKIDYYVYLNPTDAIVTQITPLTGTVGTEIALTGFNFDLVSKVLFNGIDVLPAAFTTHSATQIKFAVPAGSYTPGNNAVTVAIVWGSANTQTTVTDAFQMSTPKPDAFTAPGAPPAMGDELTFTGVNMDLLDEIWVGNLKAVITAQSATSVKISIPAGTYTGASGNQAVVNIVGYWGTPAQTTTLAQSLTIDVTVSVVAPTFTTVIPADGGTAAPYRFYLRKEVAVTGTDMLSITAIKVGTLDAAIKAGSQTGTSLTFIVPDGFTFTTATPQDITAVYGEANLTAMVLADAKIYPFFYWKDVVLCIPTNTATATRGTKVFFSLDDGRNITGDEWVSARFDGNALDCQNTANGFAADKTTMTAANTINTAKVTSALYYNVKPYIFTTIDSNSKYTFQSPAGSTGQLRNIQYYPEGSGSLSRCTADYSSGTSVVVYRILSGTEAEEVIAGTIESVETPSAKASTSAPEMTAISATMDFVMSVQWYSYTISAIGAPNAAGVTLDNVLKAGYIYVKGATGSKVSAATDLTCTADIYWPNNTRTGVAK